MTAFEMWFFCCSALVMLAGAVRRARYDRRSERDKVRARLLGLMIERMKQNGPYR